MSVLIKICGLRTPEAVDVCLHAGADMLGFVFFPASPRHLDFTAASLLGARVKGRAMKAALTVDAEDALLADIVEALSPDLLQLHGEETPKRVLEVKSRFRLPIIKSIAIESRADLACVAEYAEVADRLLFDARAPQNASRPGGLGKAFDWRLLKDIDVRIPFMLSGGLTPDNVSEAIAITRAGGVDVSSGVERTPGEKDHDLIRAFVRAARGAGAPKHVASQR